MVSVSVTAQPSRTRRLGSPRDAGRADRLGDRGHDAALSHVLAGCLGGGLGGPRWRLPASSSSAACPVRARNTSSSDGRRSARPRVSHARGVQAAHRLDERVRAAAPDADADHAGLLVGVRLALADLGDRRDRVADPAAVGHGELEHVPADPALQLLGRARGDDQAVVDDHDLVGQFVGLVQVLGGEQQRRPVGHQRPDDVPHAQPRPRVQAGRRLVQEQHLAAGRPGWRPGPGGAACRRSSSWPPGRPRRSGRTAPAARWRGCGPAASSGGTAAR